jgi:hypothetical protein
VSKTSVKYAEDTQTPLIMPRPVTLFTGQWAHLSLADLLPLVGKMGYNGVELACWGDHFEVNRALAEPDYVKKKWGCSRSMA